MMSQSNNNHGHVDKASWWDKSVEAPIAAFWEGTQQAYDQRRASTRTQIKGEKLKKLYDIQTGIGRGVINTVGGTVEGIYTSLNSAIGYAKELATDPQTRLAFAEQATDIGQALATWATSSPTERYEIGKRLFEAGKDYGSRAITSISEQLNTDWEKAKSEGRETEQIATWATQGLLEIATILIPASKLSKVENVTKLSRSNKIKGAVENCSNKSKGTNPLSTKALWPNPNAQNQLQTIDQLKKKATNNNSNTKRSKTTHNMRVASEKLGNEGAKHYLRKQLNMDIPDSDFIEFRGPHTVNLMYIDPKTNKIYILEAKGGKGRFTTRRGRFGKNKNKPLTQGTDEYLQDVANQMTKNQSKDPNVRAQKRKYGDKIINAMRYGNYEYISVKSDYDIVNGQMKIKEPVRITPKVVKLK